MSNRHYYRCHVRGHGHGNGFFSGTIGGLSRKFRLPRGVIIVGFVMLFIMSAPLAIAVFVGTWYWLKHPGRVEAAVDRTMESMRRAFSSGGGRVYENPRTATAAGPDDDVDFSELRARFDDLERRARNMEEQVSSDDYELRRKFKDID